MLSNFKNKLRFSVFLSASVFAVNNVCAQQSTRQEFFRNNVLSSQQIFNQTVFQKNRPELTPNGIRSGSFVVSPSLGVRGVFDDNIFSQNDNEVDDFIAIVSPSLVARSDWNAHSFTAYAKGNLATYDDNDSENYDDYIIGANGRLDVSQGTFVTGGLSYAQQHEDRGAPDSNFNSDGPNVYDNIVADLGFHRKVSKISLGFDNRFTRFDFENGLTASATPTVINNDLRDRNEYLSSVRLGYELSPNYEAFVAAGYNKREYDESLSGRDSEGYQVTTGAAFDFTGKLKGDVFVGYLEQDYDNSALSNISEVTSGANLLWNPTGLTSVQAGVVRGVQETTLAGFSGALTTSYNLNVEHELLRSLFVGFNAGYTQIDFENGSSNQREDDVYLFASELKYLVNRNLSVVLNYTMQDRDSSEADQDFTRNRFMLGLSVGL